MVLMRPFSRSSAAALAGALALLGSCGSPPRLDAPDGFLALHDAGPSRYKAITPDGARLCVRSFADRDRGSLDFWSEAVVHDLVERRGYVASMSSVVNDAAGNQGVAHTFETQQGGRTCGYMIAVFALGDRVQVVEFVADKARFDALLEQVIQSLSSLRPARG